MGLLVKCMLRLACVLLYQGRFKSHRSGGSRISLRVRSILVTFCIYLCSSYIILVLCAILCSFSTSNSLVLAFSQFACVCMFVCVLCIEQGEAFQTCVDTRTYVPTFFVLQYVTVITPLPASENCNVYQYIFTSAYSMFPFLKED